MSFGSDVLFNLACTDDGLLVLSSSKDLKIMDIATRNIVTYDYSNGLSDCEPGWNTMTKDLDGNVWLATQSPNVLKFNPRKLFSRKHSPRLFIEKVESSTNNVDWKPVGNFEKLNYRNKNLKIGFAGLCFSNPHAVSYRYRLLGYQDEWSAAISENEVFFTNLPDGNYEFQLIADCGDDDTQTPIVSQHFSLTPAFWQTTWFLIVCIVLLMAASAGLALYIQRRKNRVLLERLETERELNDLRIRSIRLRAIPHFNANVLAAIEYYIMNLSKTEALRLLGIYSRFTFQTLREVDRASRSLNEELEYVKMYLELEKLRFVNKFDYQIDIEPTVDVENVQLPNMILHTYCEKAVKHGLSSKNGDGVLNSKIIQSGTLVSVSVEDNGVGREAASQNKNIPSSKQGLDILSRQIEIYNRFNETKINQKIDDLYTDGQPSGTRFTVEVPYGFVYQ
jgi:hypothetical protein